MDTMDASARNTGWTTEIESVDADVGSIGWTTALETGIDVLDEQHHRYVDLLSDYFTKVTALNGTDQKNNQLIESFNFLRQYSQEHFATEESIMKDAGYPDSLAHTGEHLRFMDHVGKLYKTMKTKGYSPELSREVNYYTVEWFIDHILMADMKLVEFLKTRH